MSIPKFRHGVLLFCRNTLALDCCPGDEGWGWYDDEDHSDYKPEPPCDPPTGPDRWGIYGLCFTGDCGGDATPVTVGFHLGGEDEGYCAFSGAVPTEAYCDKFTCLVTPQFSGNLHWSVWSPAGKFTMEQTVIAGVQYDLTIYLDRSDGERMFEEEGMREFISKVTICDGSRCISAESYRWIWGLDVSNYVDIETGALTPFVIPMLYANALNVRIKNDQSKRVYSLQHVVGQYGDSGRAGVVLGGYESTIQTYLRRCMCRIECVFDDYGSGGGDGNYPTAYEGVYDSSSNPTPRSAGLFCPYQLSFSMWTSSEACELYLQMRDKGGAWTTIIGGSDDEWDYDAYVPVCREFQILIKYPANTAFSFGVNWQGVTTVGETEECTSAIEEAFALVPTY